MIDIKYSIWTYLRKPNNQVVIRVRWEGKRYEANFIPGIYADPAKWDVANQKAKNACTHHVGNKSFTSADINGIIADYKAEIDQTFVEFGADNKVPTELEFKSVVNERLGRNCVVKSTSQLTHKKSIADLLEDFLKEGRQEKNWNCINEEKYRQAVNQLSSACPGIRAEYITVDTMHKLKAWYISNKYNNRTTNKQFTMLKAFLRWINQQDGYRIPSKVLSYNTHLKVPKKNVRFLSYEELVAFEQFPLSKPYLCKARDLWCFMAYTSLRYSDLAKLKTGHIQNNRLTLMTKKTVDRISVPLCDGALRILKKYEGQATADGHIFPVMSNQRMNDFIKEAAKEAGIDRPFIDTYFVGTERKDDQNPMHEVLTCHDARRTFVSVSLALNISHEVVMKATGHSSYKTMQPYVETANETQDIEMEKWNKNQHRSQIISMLDNMNSEQLLKAIELLKNDSRLMN